MNIGKVVEKVIYAYQNFGGGKKNGTNKKSSTGEPAPKIKTR
jgi:hypothetical protein